jgi:hypothetical protein
MDDYVVLNAPGDNHFRAMLDVMAAPISKKIRGFLPTPRASPISPQWMN